MRKVLLLSLVAILTLAAAPARPADAEPADPSACGKAEAPVCGQAEVAPSRFPAQMVPLDEEIDDDSMEPVKKAVEERVKAGDKTVMLRIDSPGGQLFATWKFVQFMESQQSTGVKFVCAGDVMVASGAFTIMQACDERLVTDRTALLEHHAHMTLSGNPVEMEKELRAEKIIDLARLRYDARRLTIPWKEFMKNVDAGDWWMDVDEAKKFHAIDGTVEIKDLPPLVTLEKKEEKGFLLFH